MFRTLITVSALTLAFHSGLAAAAPSAGSILDAIVRSPAPDALVRKVRKAETGGGELKTGTGEQIELLFSDRVTILLGPNSALSVSAESEGSSSSLGIGTGIFRLSSGFGRKMSIRLGSSNLDLDDATVLLNVSVSGVDVILESGKEAVLSANGSGVSLFRPGFSTSISHDANTVPSVARKAPAGVVTEIRAALGANAAKGRLATLSGFKEQEAAALEAARRAEAAQAARAQKNAARSQNRKPKNASSKDEDQRQVAVSTRPDQVQGPNDQALRNSIQPTNAVQLLLTQSRQLPPAGRIATPEPPIGDVPGTAIARTLSVDRFNFGEVNGMVTGEFTIDDPTFAEPTGTVTFSFTGTADSTGSEFFTATVDAFRFDDGVFMPLQNPETSVVQIVSSGAIENLAEFQEPGTVPVIPPNYDSLQWGLIDGDLFRELPVLTSFPNTGWVAGDIASPQEITQFAGTALYTGHVFGNVIENSPVRTRIGTYQNVWDFGLGSGTASLRFDGTDYTGQTTVTQNGWTGTVGAPNRAGELNGSFVTNGVPEQPNGVIGTFKIEGTTDAPYVAEGIVAAER